MIKIINTTEARNNLSQILKQTFFRQNSYVIQKRGQPYALIIGLSDYLKAIEIAKELDKGY